MESNINIDINFEGLLYDLMNNYAHDNY